MSKAIGRKWTAEKKKEAKVRHWIKANSEIISYLMDHPDMVTDLRSRIFNCFFDKHFAKSLQCDPKYFKHELM